MSSSQTITNLLDKLTELQAVFVLAGRALPFIDEVTQFMKEISPLLFEIHSSLAETSTKMPSASAQLDKVTEATEQATNEILNLADGVLMTTSRLKQAYKKYFDQVDVYNTREGEFLAILDDENADQDEVKQAIAEAKRRHSLAILATKRFQEEQINASKVINDSISRIMMSLQVQDITAQQLASVRNMVDSVQTALNNLVNKMGVSDSTFVSSSGLESGNTYDANASYDWSKDRQNEVDSLINRYIEDDEEVLGEETGNETSDTEKTESPAPAEMPPFEEPAPEAVDLMFDALNSKDSPDPDPDPIIPEPDQSDAAVQNTTEQAVISEEPDFTSPISQDDIDSLFG